MGAEQIRSTDRALDASGAAGEPMPRGVAVLLHAAVLLICVLAIYSAKVVGSIDPGESRPNGNPALALVIALAVLIPIIGLRARLPQRAFGGLVLALGLAYTFSLAFEPPMSPPLPEDVAMAYQISWAHAALLAMLVAWCACVLGAGRRAICFTGFEAPTLTSALALSVLGAVLLLSVGRQYDAVAGHTVGLIIKAVQYALICVVAVTVSGARRVGPWLHVYVGAALLIALGLAMLGGGSAGDEYAFWGALL